jgi:hypothetical protein
VWTEPSGPGGTNRARVATSFNGGRTWSAAADLDDVPSRSNFGTEVLYAGDAAYAHFTLGAQGEDAAVVFSPNRGASWSSPEIVPAAGSRYYTVASASRSLRSSGAGLAFLTLGDASGTGIVPTILAAAGPSLRLMDTGALAGPSFFVVEGVTESALLGGTLLVGLALSLTPTPLPANGRVIHQAFDPVTELGLTALLPILSAPIDPCGSVVRTPDAPFSFTAALGSIAPPGAVTLHAQAGLIDRFGIPRYLTDPLAIVGTATP